ncbi:nucleic acid-binding protein [Sulfolobus sp. E5-1-F]|uniref:Zn-ribbon domain-containing OB-fold protein n=1 Tax=Sulfolobaceae TaxID=118883 RepID=UPI0012968FF0|nr:MULTISPECIES: Zn-ribbon domain-containing OB-fold protein [unclassified Sulfolobus]QGA53645.1 nucleic acid-binding protein [Sulfolobus sp. E5-1-F]QGA68698.1 nucleic acid-binding protein [Sulfolobus sp. E11-6]
MKDDEIRELYFKYFNEEKLPFIQCNKCGYRFYYPRVFCPKCHSSDIEVRFSKGHGKIFAMTKIYRKDGSHVVYGIVELEEGFRMYSNIVEESQADIGKRVELIFKEINGKKYPLFRVV